MNFTLNYSPIGSLSDVEMHKFEDIDQVTSFISNIVYPLKRVNDKVYLLALDNNIIVTEEGLLIDKIFDNYQNYLYPYEYDNISLYEFESYEEAYDCALLLKETSHLCYKNQHNGQSNT